jgi:23S rRNA pseudouridine1911/1915/1917 synthase
MTDTDFNFQTSMEDLGKRLDTVICAQVPGISRSRVQLLIRHGKVTIDGQTAKASTPVRPGQSVFVQLTQLELLRPRKPRGEDIALDVIFEDQHIIAVNKPAGMVVHPAKGHWTGTLTAALMFHFQNLSTVGGEHRPGIVHRLDRDTSGVMVVARHDWAHTRLMRQFERRTVQKKYLAVVSPAPDRDRDRIEAPIGVHPYQREKMAIRTGQGHGKPARTFYEVTRRIGRCGIVAAWPKTGRTHQIRVHLAHAGCPILADRLYSGRSWVSEGWLRDGIDAGERLLERQALHAESIEFRHPVSGEPVLLEAPLPPDLVRLLEFLEGAD